MAINDWQTTDQNHNAIARLALEEEKEEKKKRNKIEIFVLGMSLTGVAINMKAKKVLK